MFFKRRNDTRDIAFEIWAAAQIGPNDSIEESAARIDIILTSEYFKAVGFGILIGFTIVSLVFAFVV